METSRLAGQRARLTRTRTRAVSVRRLRVITLRRVRPRRVRPRRECPRLHSRCTGLQAAKYVSNLFLLLYLIMSNTL